MQVNAKLSHDPLQYTLSQKMIQDMFRNPGIEAIQVFDNLKQEKEETF